MVNKLNYAHNILCLKINQPSFFKTVKNYLKHKWALTGVKDGNKMNCFKMKARQRPVAFFEIISYCFMLIP